MATVITKPSDFTKIFQARISMALKMTQDEIYKKIQENISKYYKEKVFRDRYTGNISAIPNVYDRTYQFLNSLLKTDVAFSGNSISCKVMIDVDSLNYNQPGQVVVDMINRGFHADTGLNQDGIYETPYDIYSDSNFWDDSINDLGGFDGILALFKKNLKKCKVPII